ncbi:MAG: hypothetical protein WCH83_02205 [Alphaproteobacteria bacterium]|jgi:hypothetical protein
MKPSATVVFGGLSAEAKLPGWTLPLVVQLAQSVVREAANGEAGDPALSVVPGTHEARVVDARPDAFSAEFGSSTDPASPRLLPALAALRTRST